MSSSKGEVLFKAQLEEFGIPAPEEEYKFLEHRRFRFDFAWPQVSIAVEIEGGTWVAGRHSRGKGFESDCNKYNFATRDGWKVYRFTTNMVESREGIKFLIGAWPVKWTAITSTE
tara:strand:- start:1275 stop:1619 length:345 start_codon:yes stop_codon:yes gene_type:complete